MVKFLLLFLLATPGYAAPLKFTNRFVTRPPKAATEEVNLTTNIPSRVVVKYGLKPNIWLNSLVDNTYKTKHTITINGLKFNTKYYYIMKVFDKGDKQFKSQILNFTTER